MLNPYILSFDLPFRINFKELGFSATLDPSLLMDFLSGYYDSGTTTVTIDGKLYKGRFNCINSVGLGFGLGVSGDFYFTDMLGIGVKAGTRFLQSPLVFQGNGSIPFSLLDPATKQAVGIDLGGTYMTIGAMLKFN